MFVLIQIKLHQKNIKLTINYFYQFLDIVFIEKGFPFSENVDGVDRFSQSDLKLSFRTFVVSMVDMVRYNHIPGKLKQIIKYNRWQQRNGLTIPDVTSVKYNKENEICCHII